MERSGETGKICITISITFVTFNISFHSYGCGTLIFVSLIVNPFVKQSNHQSENAKRAQLVKEVSEVKQAQEMAKVEAK